MPLIRYELPEKRICAASPHLLVGSSLPSPFLSVRQQASYANDSILGDTLKAIELWAVCSLAGLVVQRMNHLRVDGEGKQRFRDAVMKRQSGVGLFTV